MRLCSPYQQENQDERHRTASKGKTPDKRGIGIDAREVAKQRRLGSAFEEPGTGREGLLVQRRKAVLMAGEAIHSRAIGTGDRETGVLGKSGPDRSDGQVTRRKSQADCQTYRLTG